ncbi:non-ribosomal peptide synthetase [Streptomyces albireticuli]|uniref:Non-ribosomal peptide synthetase n=1 Tax=Streptomyces albireticuli TaxID=1940 RepID=A0A1Z2KZA9_9ACTN|nr:non-ribosomal peptide synthetase [Streptomyces albireticuli]ARZ67360.1 non-ribosomal peptide synthetase [Streptomyces albireticuli]
MQYVAENDGRSATGGPATVPASRKEEALWLLERFVPGTGVNNLSLAFRVAGRLRPELLQETLTFLIRRHEVLRTAFVAGDLTLARRVLDADEAKVVVTEAELPAEALADGADDVLDGILTRYVGAGFAMDGGPLLRARLFRGPQEDVFCVALHHLVFDTISATTLLGEFAVVYSTLAAGGRPEETLGGVVPAASDIEPTDRSRRFWRKQLRDFGSVRPRLWLGADAGDEPDLVGGTITRPLPDEAVAAVRRLQEELRAPEAVVLLAVYYLLLTQHGAGPDLVVGSPVNSRRPEDAAAIGYHVNVVPLRLRVDPEQGFAELVRKARSVFINSISHADVPVDSLLLEVDRADSAGWRNTLFQHVFNYVPGVGVEEFTLDGMPARFQPVENGFSKFDLEFFVLPSDDGIRLRTAYHKGAFAQDEIEALIRRYEALLIAVGADVERPVGELSAWSPADHEIIGAAHGAAPAGPVVSVPEAVAERVRSTPEAVAVVDGGRELTYGQLWAAAERNRERLVAAGLGRGDVVAVAASRGAELAAATLGVWLAGAAYLPVDPDHPEQRIAYQLSDSGARAVLLGPGVELAVEAGVFVAPMAAVGEPGEAPAVPGPVTAAGSSDLAYLIYTSGSTGLPKGTLLTHGNLANLVEHFRAELGADAGESTLWLTTFTFDISALELFLPLVTGGRLVVAPDEARTDGAVLAGLLTSYGVGIVQATPTTWRLVVEAAGPVLSGRRVLCGGEPLPVALARELAATGCVLRNVYGPTETTIWSTSGLVGPDVERVSAGRPVRDTRVFVADPAGRELPVLVPGELCVAGGGVAAGYHGRPGLTAERFGEHASYGRFYRTGDRARWLADGTVEVLGRVDRQIKLRGVRIELGELEAVLAGHPAVRACAVVVAGDAGGDGVLVAFAESAAGEELVEELWQRACARLPRASVPQEFVVVESLPTNASQKVDYPALVRAASERLARAAADAGADAAATDGGAPAAHEDELVATLMGLWGEVLGRDAITPDTNFFTHGGHSLLGVKLVQRLEETVHVTLKLAQIFSYPTPATLADFVRANMVRTNS